MSNSTPTYNIFSTPPILPGEHQTLSHSEHPSLKKQRVCEALVLNPTVPVMSDNVMTPNLVNRRLNGDSGVAKMQLCRMFYYKRKCTYAGRCRFSHVNPEKVEQDLGRFRDKSNRTSSGCSGDHRSGYGQFASKEKSPKSAMWKTKLCKKWEITGGCPYGNTCYFAHGQAELRKVGRHNASASRIMKMNVSNSFSTGNAGPGSGITCKQRLQGEGCAFKWKSLEKINGIYADWIEDTHLFQSSFSK